MKQSDTQESWIKCIYLYSCVHAAACVCERARVGVGGCACAFVFVLAWGVHFSVQTLFPLLASGIQQQLSNQKQTTSGQMTFLFNYSPYAETVTRLSGIPTIPDPTQQPRKQTANRPPRSQAW